MGKIYKLVDAHYRETVNLTLYTYEITEAVHKYVPKAVVTVVFDGFYTDRELTKIQSIRISQELRSGALEGFTFYRPCLFTGYDMDETPNSEESTSHEEEANHVAQNNSETTSKPKNRVCKQPKTIQGKTVHRKGGRKKR